MPEKVPLRGSSAVTYAVEVPRRMPHVLTGCPDRVVRLLAADGSRQVVPDPQELAGSATDETGRRPSPFPAPSDVRTRRAAVGHVRARALRRQGR